MFFYSTCSMDSLLRSGARGLPEFPASMEIDMPWEPAREFAGGATP